MKAILSLVFMVLFGWTTLTHARPLDKAEREELSHIVSYLHYVNTRSEMALPLNSISSVILPFRMVS